MTRDSLAGQLRSRGSTIRWAFLTLAFATTVGRAQVPLTPVFLVNEVASGSQRPSAVASDRLGRTLIDYRDVFAYPYGQAGRFLEIDQTMSPVFELGPRDGSPGDSTVFSLRDGGWLFSAWAEPIHWPVSGPIFRWLAEDGSALGPLIPLCADFVCGHARVAEQASGDLHSVFIGRAPEDIDAPREVYFRRMTTAGTFLTKAMPITSTPPTEENWNAWVAAGPAERSLIVWSGWRGEATEIDVHGRIVDREGRPVGAPFALGTDPAGWQQVPQAESLGEDTFVALWEGASAASPYYDVVFRLFSSEGTPLTPEIPVSTSPTLARYSGSLSTDGSGRFVVAWTSDGQEGYLEEIYFREFRSDGTPVGPEVRASAGAGREGWADESPYVALSPAGTITLAWSAGNLEADWDGAAVARRYFRGCAEGARRLALSGGRFEVCAIWSAYDGTRGAGVPVALTEDSGGFWFFEPENLEVVVKILDGCGVNQRFWLYSAGLTDVEVTLGVIDTWTGQTWVRDTRLASPYPPIQDVEALPVCAGSAPVGSPGAAAAENVTVANGSEVTFGASATCAADEHHVCLQGGRFRVSASYDTAIGLAGEAVARPLSSESAAFWFFGEQNLELFVKVLDGCDPFGTFWVFAAGLTDVEVRLRVEDTESGAVRNYENPLGSPFQPILDAAAFAGCT